MGDNTLMIDNIAGETTKQKLIWKQSLVVGIAKPSIFSRARAQERNC